MKAVLPRIERLYESEVQRWRAAWNGFLRQIDLALRGDERRAVLDYETLSRDQWLKLDPILTAWTEEAGLTEEALETWIVFHNTLWQAVPPDLDTTDLTLWPDGVPCPPADVPALWRIAQREAAKGEDERLASGFFLLLKATASAARLYTRETK